MIDESDAPEKPEPPSEPTPEVDQEAPDPYKPEDFEQE